MILLFVFFSKAQEDTLIIKYNNSHSNDPSYFVVDTFTYYSPFERHFLIGTTVLPWTQNQLMVKNFGLNLDSVAKTNCLNNAENVKGKKDKINYVTITDTSLTVDVSIYSNCCYDFLCDVSIDDKGNLMLIYQGYGDYCSCTCCFGLRFYFTDWFLNDEGEKLKSIRLSENKSEEFKLEY